MEKFILQCKKCGSIDVKKEKDYSGCGDAECCGEQTVTIKITCQSCKESETIYDSD